MKLAVKIIAIAFLALMIVFSLYETALGNPFFDEVSPVLVTLGFLGLAVMVIIAVFRRNKKA